MISMKEPQKPNQVILDYISKHYQYDPDTGIVSKDGKKTGTKRDTGYVMIKITAPNPIGDGSVFLYHTFGHRVGWYLTYGDWTALEIDHIDGDPSNNKMSNLREATRSQNARNTRKTKRKTFAPYKGVDSAGRTRGKQWRAVITHAKKRIHIGYFDTPEEAAKAYDAKARELFGEYACLNFPD